ncbi:MAG TPA: ABATE domain-containing protein [Jiangellaceae bacterium]
MVEIEIVGNALCLDFTNTVSARPVARWDVLAAADDAADWAAAVGHPLTALPANVSAELARTREFREIVYRVFRPLANGERPDGDDLDAVMREYADAAAAGSLRPGGNTYSLSWPGGRTLRTLRWEVAVSSLELLTRGPLDRLGECPSCSWLFLDTSKNGRRRWCSMATCGSRDKARRYYARHST